MSIAKAGRQMPSKGCPDAVIPGKASTPLESPRLGASARMRGFRTPRFTTATGRKPEKPHNPRQVRRFWGVKE